MGERERFKTERVKGERVSVERMERKEEEEEKIWAAGFIRQNSVILFKPNDQSFTSHGRQRTQKARQHVVWT